MNKTMTTLLATAVLALAACGSSGDDAETPNPDADEPAVAALCAQDEPDCDDVGYIDAPLPLDPNANADDSGDLVAVGGMTADGGLTVDQALTGDVTGVLAVTGNLFDDGTGLRMCSALAESFPPQCGGSSLTVDGFGFDRMIELPNYEDIQVQSSGTVTWTDGQVTLFGEVVDGTLVVGLST
jgi:hypothetical protein